ncbi:MAG: glucose-6-phosphate isomerase, partial [Flavobacteriales bacterium]
MANCIAQGEALMKGKTEVEVKAELVNKGLNETEIKAVLPYKTFSGNKPSSTFVFDKLDPKNLGSLVAMYEHKIFVQGWVWDVYSYDQWGVELGKQLASEVLKELKGGAEMSHDQSTSYLIKRLKKGHLKT